MCTHIVQAIRKETLRVREEWENALSAHPDADDVSSLEERCAITAALISHLSYLTMQ